MHETASKMLVLISLFLTALTLPSTTYSQTLTGTPPLRINLSTSKPSYELGEKVLITGQLEINRTGVFEPVSDGLITLQMNDPHYNLFAVRTKPTGTNITTDWPMEILDITPCGCGGEPKYTFKLGDYMGFNVTIKNNYANEYEAILTVNPCYSDGTPFAAEIMWTGSITGGKTKTIVAYPVLEIPGDAKLGEATVYATLLTGLPEDSGFAYCPEKSASFTITISGGGATSTSTNTEIYSTSTAGTFNLTFQISDHGGMIGNYTTYACSFYDKRLATNQTTFETILLADLNDDGIVDIRDVSFVARHFGTGAGDPDFDPKADICPLPYGDGFVDIRDVSFVARRYGHYGTK